MATYAEKRDLLEQSLKLLVTHDPFIQFMQALESLREQAILDSCRMDVVENPNKVCALLGEVRCYTDIKSLVAEYAQKHIDN